MGLKPFEIVNGTFSLILVIFFILVGLRIALRYKTTHDRTYLLFGVTWMTLVQSWYPSSISFLLTLFTGEGLTPMAYFIIGNVGIPASGVCFIIAWTDLLCKEKQKFIVFIYVIIAIIMYIIIFYLLFTDISTVGTLNGPVDAEYSLIIVSFLVFALLNIFICGILMARISLLSNDPELRLKGKFLIIGLCSFITGAILDSAIPLGILSLTLVRLLLISSAIEFLGGFILPNWMKKLLIKEKTE